MREREREGSSTFSWMHFSVFSEEGPVATTGMRQTRWSSPYLCLSVSLSVSLSLSKGVKALAVAPLMNNLAINIMESQLKAIPPNLHREKSLPIMEEHYPVLVILKHPPPSLWSSAARQKLDRTGNITKSKVNPHFLFT